MALKNILVHLDQTTQSPDRFELALSVAKRQQAQLTGFYATSSPYFSAGPEKIRREGTRAEFVERAATAGVDFTWETDGESTSSLPLWARLNHQAFFADLVILGQPDAAAGPPPAPPRDLPARMIESSGRPVITVPYAGQFHSAGERVMVAWRSGRTAARAIADARPFLARAKEVILLSFAKNAREHEQAEETLQRLRGHLALHEIKASTEARIISGIGIGDALLNRVAEEGIDLLVVGGRPPSAKDSLPGHLLKDMTVPVLMSN